MWNRKYGAGQNSLNTPICGLIKIPTEHTKYKTQKLSKYCHTIGCQKVQKLSASGGLRPPDPLTRGSAPGPRWGHGPQTPGIGSRYRARHVSEPSHFSLRSDAYGYSRVLVDRKVQGEESMARGHEGSGMWGGGTVPLANFFNCQVKMQGLCIFIVKKTTYGQKPGRGLIDSLG